MPSISIKGNLMPQSPIRKLVPYAEKAKKNGVKVYHLNIGQPDIKTPKVALDAVKNNTIEVLSYAQSEGSEIYREKLCTYYESHHIHVDKKDIVVTTGASEALIFTLSCITNSGDEIIIPEPFYANYSAFSSVCDVNVVPVISSIENNFALPAMEDFEKLITPKTKAILICNPGNPTGQLYSKEEIQKLKQIVSKHDLFLISDEVYREFTYDGASHHSVLQEDGIDEHAILIDSVSKRYSMCGARIGCIVTKNQSLVETVIKFAQSRLSPPTYALLASEAALETPKSYFDDLIIEYTERRDTLISELQKIEGVKVAKPKGAFYCLVELPIEDTDDFAQWILDKFTDNNETVMLAPASGFYSTEGEGKNQVRIAYVLNKKDLKRSVEIIKKALFAYKQ